MRFILTKYFIKKVNTFSIVIFLIVNLTSCKIDLPKSENELPNKNIVIDTLDSYIEYGENEIHGYFKEENISIDLIKSKEKDSIWDLYINDLNLLCGESDYEDCKALQLSQTKNNTFLYCQDLCAISNIDIIEFDSLLNPIYFFRFHRTSHYPNPYMLVYVSYFSNQTEYPIENIKEKYFNDATFSKDIDKDSFIEVYYSHFKDIKNSINTIKQKENLPTNINNSYFFKEQIQDWKFMIEECYGYRINKEHYEIYQNNLNELRKN